MPRIIWQGVLSSCKHSINFLYRYVQSTYPDTPSATVVFSWRQQAEKVNKAACGEQDLKTEHHLGVYSGRFTQAKEQRDATKDALM